jgi:glutathione S-transferase
MRLYEHPLSSYVQKVKIALREKDIDFTLETGTGVGTASAAGDFLDGNLRAEVPLLVDGDLRIFDSTIILEYLEDKVPTPALLPRDPALRARARMIEEMCDTSYEAINWGIGKIAWFRRAEGELADTLRTTAASQTAKIQAWLETQLADREWFTGETFGWADLSVAPYLNRSILFGNGPPPGSPLDRWMGRIRQRPSVAKTFEEFMAAQSRMADAAERLASGVMRREYRDHRLEWMIKSGGIEVVRDGLAKNNIRFTWPEA